MVCVLVPRVAARGLKPPTMTQFVIFISPCTSLRGKSKDWLTQYNHNVSE